MQENQNQGNRRELENPGAATSINEAVKALQSELESIEQKREQNVMPEKITDKLVDYLLDAIKTQDALINKMVWILLLYSVIGQGKDILTTTLNTLERQELNQIRQEAPGREPIRMDWIK